MRRFLLIITLCLSFAFAFTQVACLAAGPVSPSDETGDGSGETIIETGDETDETGSESEDPSDTSETGSESEDPSDSSEPEDPIDPPDQPENDLKKILFIGDGVVARDIFFGLSEVFYAEGYTDYTFGMALYNNASLSTHASIINDSAARYTYFVSKNGGAYTNTKNQTLPAVLAAEDWEIVFIEIGPQDVINSSV